MAEGPAISIQNVAKTYRIWSTPAARLVSPLLRAASDCLPAQSHPAQWLQRKSAARYRDFCALQALSFDVARGESVGIIGRNGSGKSTLLQIIAGTLQPTTGSIRVNGRVAALLELGSGFNPDFTGRENVFLNGAVLGLTRSEVEARFDAIAAFADIGDFMDQPVMTYSSGMQLRLAFAVQTAVDPDILIVDEALSVGDFFFQQKCFQRIRSLKRQGATILFVSHDLASVRDLCDRTAYLRNGHLVMIGDTQRAIARYLLESDPNRAAPADEAPKPGIARDAEHLLASCFWRPAEAAAGGPCRLLGVALCDEQGQPSMRFRLDEIAVFRAYFAVDAAVDLHGALEIKNRHGQIVSSLGTRIQGEPARLMEGGQTGCLEARVALGLEAGEYSFQCCLGRPSPQPNRGIRLTETPWLGPLTIAWDYEMKDAPFLGMFHLDATLKVATVD